MELTMERLEELIGTVVTKAVSGKAPPADSKPVAVDTGDNPLSAQLAALEQRLGRLEKPETEADEETDEAEMGMRGMSVKGITGPLNKIGGKWLPVGTVLVGGGLGALGAIAMEQTHPVRGADGKSDFKHILVHGVAAAAFFYVVKRFTKDTVLAVAVGAPFGANVARGLLPIDEWAAKFAANVTGKLPFKQQGYSGGVYHQADHQFDMPVPTMGRNDIYADIFRQN